MRRTARFDGTPRRSKSRVMESSLPQRLGEPATEQTSPNETKPHLIRQGITSLRRNAFCILVLVLLTTVCSRLSQTAAAPKRLRSSWYLLAAPLWLPLTPPEVPRCLAPSLPSSQPALLDASPLKPSPALLSSPLEGCITRQEQNLQALH